MQPAFLSMLLLFFCLASAFAPNVTYGQERQADTLAPNALLSVSGEVEHPLQLSGAELAKLPRHTARVTDHDGVEATFEGPPLVEILRLAGVKLGEQLRGQEMTTYVLVKAADSYQVVFAVAEARSWIHGPRRFSCGPTRRQTTLIQRRAATHYCPRREAPRPLGETGCFVDRDPCGQIVHKQEGSA